MDYSVIDDLETSIRQIWEEVFNLECLDQTVNFFDLGGHSIHATRIIAKINQQFNIQLLIGDLFDSPTIQGLAQTIQKTSPIPQFDSESFLDQGESTLSFAQKRLWFLYEMRPEIPLYSFPIFFKGKGILDENILQLALDCLMARHENLRLKIQVVDGIPKRDILPMDIHFPLYVISTPIEKLSHLDLLAFDLNKDLPCRCYLYKQDPLTWHLAFIFHHIIFDDWSINIFSKELSLCYLAIYEKKPLLLSSINRPCSTFAVWEERNIKEAKLKYWIEVLKNVQETPLPYDFLRPKLLTYRGATFIFQADLNLFLSLKEMASQHQVSLFMLLLAAFQWTLALIAQSEDISVGSPVSNRWILDDQDHIGYFINTLVFRLIFSLNEPFLKVLQRVKEVVLAGYSAQEVPFEKIVSALNLSRDLSKNPLFQVMFSIAHEADMIPLEFPSNIVSQTTIPSALSKFDLTLHAVVKDNSIDFNFEFSEELFEKFTIMKLSNIYLKILQKIVQDGQICLIDVATLFSDSKIPIKIKSSGPPQEKLILQESRQLPLQLELENQLLNIWKDLLQVDNIAVDSDFFALGGDSMLVLQLCDQIKKKLKLDALVLDVFQYPTIRALANYYQLPTKNHQKDQALCNRDRFSEGVLRYARASKRDLT